MTAREWGWLVALSVLWGGAFFMTSVALKEMTPFGLAFFRISIAALTLGIAVWVMGGAIPARLTDWRAFTILAIFGNAVPFCLLAWAQTQISGGLAAILNAMTPIFTILIAHVFTQDEKITLGRFLGILLAVCGVAVIVGPSALTLHGGQLWAEAAVLGASCCYAIAGVYGRRFGGYPLLIPAFMQLMIGSALVLPVLLLAGTPVRVAMPSLTTIACVLGLAVFSTALAFGIYFRILRSAGATNAGLVTILVPVTAILLGALILGDQLVARHYAGLVMIATGLLIIDGRPLQVLRSVVFRARNKPDVSGPAAPHMLNEPHKLR